MRTLHYVAEKLGLAIVTLATRAEPIQQRLAAAGAGPLASLNAEDFPEGNMRSEYERFLSAITAVQPVGDEGQVVASTSQMSDGEAEELARTIVRLKTEVGGRIRNTPDQ